MNEQSEKLITSISTKMAEVHTQVGTILAGQDEEKKQRVALQKQVDAIDMQLAKRLSNGDVPQGLVEKLKADDGAQRLIKDRRGSAVIHFNAAEMGQLFTKTTITSGAVGTATSGVLQIDRISGITAEARQVLRVRDLLTSNPTVMQVVDFVKVSQPLTVGSPAPEASTKVENQLNFVSVSEKVRCLATWIPATRQIIDDMTELANFIATSMPYYVNLGEEIQLLSGDGTGENLHGLIPQASAFQASLLPAGGSRLDYLGAVIEQIQTGKELDPTFVILHPHDLSRMRLQKDSLGRYILGDPQGTGPTQVWGLTIVPTTSIGSGVFLVGSGSGAASEIRDRMEMQVEISTEHQDYFVRNMVAIRAEKRLALIVKRPNSYVTGSFTGASPQ